MTNNPAAPRSAKIIRWTARIWSILATLIILFIFFGGEGIGQASIAPVDIFLLSLTGVALVRLFVAWRWELFGGIFTQAMLFLREIVWVILKGQWLLGFLFLWILIAPPAILFLIAWAMER